MSNKMKNINLSTTAARIRYQRQIHDMTRDDVATGTNGKVTYRSLVRWEDERNDSTINSAALIELAKLFGVSVDWLLCISPKPGPEPKRIMEKYINEEALAVYGIEAQSRQYMEEAAELTVALNRMLRKRDDASFSSIAEEIADVEIMLQQITQYYGLQNTVNRFMEQKYRRLAERLGFELEEGGNALHDTEHEG